jgi:thioredoxin-like negative regulator of GroEL
MAPHCVECRARQPDLDAVAERFRQSVTLTIVDATRRPDLAAELSVKGTPTLIAFRDGAELARVTGRRSGAELVEIFEAVLGDRADRVASAGRGDRIALAIAGGVLALGGLLGGPAWPVVALGAALLVVGQVRGRRG